MEHILSAGGQMVVEQGGKMVAGYMGFDESLETLKAKVNQLCCQANDMKTELMEKEKGGQRKRKREVESWLQQVEQLEKDFETFSESIPQGGSIMEKARKATKVQPLEKMTERVEKLRDEGRNIGKGELTVSLSRVYPPLIVDPLSGRTSQSNLEEIYGWLEDENVRSIGVYGMGGVGKTTLAKHIYNRILQNESRVNVYWVTVSQDFNIRKLQDDIIRTVGLTISEVNEEQRAAILRNHLVENNVVLILDDVWDNIRLEKLGVPLKGCKLILTTRSLDVCRRIGCQKLFKVEIFNEEEAWNLFKEILVLQDDHIVLTDAIEKYAKELAKKCGGLPLAVNTVAASMRGVTDDHIWRNAINNFQNASLQMEGLENDVFEILKFSYNRLNDQRLKECFLYCCLYPEDGEIEKDEVIMKLIAEGLCEDRDEGHSILNKLVNVFLLEGGEGYVKMHDLMREMAFKISKFMVKSEVIEIPEESHWIPELERVSFMGSEIKEIPDGFSPRCHNLSTLILQGKYGKLQRISESFLLYMTQLRVLDLSYNPKLECLPNSISNLENLCGLFLQGCRSIRCLPALEKMSALRVLNIKYCKKISCLPAMEKLRALRVLNIEGCRGIRELPQGMECLVSLQYLYMKGTGRVLEIPKGVISKLRNLRCLHLHYCGRLVQSEEVNSLPHLQEFRNCYDELQSFNTTLFTKLEQLECYQIFVGEIYDKIWDNKRNVYLIGISFKRESGQVLLPANICELQINKCEGLNGCIADYFQSIESSDLRELQVYDCEEVEWILNSEQITENAAASTQAAFKSLEVLNLSHLPKLISVYKGEDVILPANGTFSFLKHLTVFACVSMKKLLPQALLQNLKNLEKILVERCDQLEVVIEGVGEDEEEGSSNTHTPLFSPSNILYLPNLKHLSIKECNSMKKLLPQALLQILKNLETLVVIGCKQLEVVIGGEVGGDEEEEGIEGSSNTHTPLFSSSNIVYLPNLKFLELWYLPKLKSICNGREMICPSIQTITILECRNVKRMPSFLPIHEATGQPYIPSSFQQISLYTHEKEWWELLEWHNPNAKHILQSHIDWPIY